ncbi:MAG TPA: DUF5666 domain-containing protein [Burkholderiaceae bacterium]|nr:DUF5666 domain-containing protein [Burkholderiaceae bacterium]
MLKMKGVAVGLLGAVLLAGCGGSDDSTTGDSPVVAESVSVGTVHGTAPTWIDVNEVRFDKQTTEVLDDDDQPASVGDLKLGMQVEVAAAAAKGNKAVARAARVAFGAAVVGPVEAVDAAAKQIKVLGQTIQTSDGTIFDGIAGGLAGVTVGSFVNVHGLLDASNGVTSATRVELRKALNVFRLRGVVSEVDEANKTLKVGGQVVSLAKLAALPKNLAQANGKVVRAVLEKEQVNAQFVARAVRGDRRFVADGKAVDIESIVTEFTSATAFKLFGLPVDASKAAFVNQAELKLGARAEVKGALVAGVLAATDVEVKLRGQKNVNVQGDVAALDAAAKTFTLNGVTIDFSGADVVFVGGDAAALVNGAKVLVTGKVAGNGARVAAQRIQFNP